ncbi:hypothetical protein BSLG_004753 [Batrachochytrium salamandrivorans]|nr:hypothetical protein BSLG_004753 [Batrachochytrium salamandrivorans]
MSAELDQPISKSINETLSGPKMKTGEFDDIKGKIGKVTDLATKVVGDNNPILQQTIQIAQNIFNIGQTIPFVAPIFAVLQIIVDIETKAREADAKCSDLLERINFMVDHLTALESASVHATTEKVVNRMESTLKSSATLIQAYRKQNAISRRLNIGNKDRFVSCAKDIETCAHDLMFSLQIQQTTQLNVLTRAVQVDDDDVAAEKFLEKHGGLEAVKKNPELVKQFASEIKLKMDDSVMQELNTNIADLINQNRAEMESKLKQNMSEAVVDGLKSLASTMKDLEREEVLGCVQCGQTYRESTNALGSCAFHESQYNGYDGKPICCGKPDACKRTKHCSKDHCKYKYAAFFERVSKIIGYSDTVNDMVSECIVDFENTDNNQSFRAGKLIRFSSGSHQCKDPQFLVSIGDVYFGSIGYHFQIYTVADVQDIQESITDLSESRLIYKIYSSQDAFVSGEWLVDDNGKICGIVFSAKTTTIDEPIVQIVRFDIATFEQIGEVEHVTRGFVSYKPETPYTFPESILLGRVVPDIRVREARTDFKTKCTSADFPVIFLVNSKPSLEANADRSYSNRDNFTATVAVFNKHSVPVTIMSASSEYRLIGQKDYTPCKDTMMADTKFPITIEPRQSAEIKFVAHILRTPADAIITNSWWYRSVIARFKPLRIRFTVEDIEENKASIVLEYVFNPYPASKMSSSDVAQITFHDWDTQSMYTVSVSGPSGSTHIGISGKSFDEDALNRLVYKAKKAGSTEVDLEIYRNFDERCLFNAWALVDLNCYRVYGFKMIMVPHELVIDKTAASMLYVACPDYGALTESRPIRYAEENVTLPTLGKIPEIDPTNDDTVDDIVVEIPTIVRSGISGGLSSDVTNGRVAQIDSVAIGQAVGVALSDRLVNLEDKLERTAASLESLVAIIKTLMMREGHSYQ